MFMISHSFCGSGIWEELSGWFGLEVSYEVAVKTLAGVTVI